VSAVSPILSALYIAPIFHIFEKRTHNLLLNISVFTLLFFDNSIFISQKKSYEKSNTSLFCSYSIISSFFKQFRLMIEHNKLEVFYFSRVTKNYNPLLLDLGPLGRFLLQSKKNWRYLSLFFNRKLSFYHHIHFYSNKALSTIKDMKMLGNSTRESLISHKWLFYRIYVILIALYSFQL